MANNQEISGMMIAESEDGQYEPIAQVSSLEEAIWMAKQDMATRMMDVRRGRDPMCPAIYRIWARRACGFICIHEFDSGPDIGREDIYAR